jgi:hypothetical protein
MLDLVGMRLGGLQGSGTGCNPYPSEIFILATLNLSHVKRAA